MEKDAKDVLEIVNFIKDRMVTRDDLDGTNARIEDLQAQINVHTQTIVANTRAIADLSSVYVHK